MLNWVARSRSSLPSILRLRSHAICSSLLSESKSCPHLRNRQAIISMPDRGQTCPILPQLTGELWKCHQSRHLICIVLYITVHSATKPYHVTLSATMPKAVYSAGEMRHSRKTPIWRAFALISRRSIAKKSLYARLSAPFKTPDWLHLPPRASLFG